MCIIKHRAVFFASAMGSNILFYATGYNIEYHLLPYKAQQTILVRHLLAHIEVLCLFFVKYTYVLRFVENALSTARFCSKKN